MSYKDVNVGRATQVKLVPQGVNNDAYFTIVANLLGDATFSQVQGAGGWQIVERPKKTAASQWYDRALYQIQMTIMFENDMLPSGKDAHQMFEQLISWVSPIPNTYQPPVFTISGPVPAGAKKLWYLYSFELREAIRDFQTGNLLQQTVQIVCYEYQSAIPGSAGHAEKATSNATSTSRPYLVKANETLQQIATGPNGYKHCKKYTTLNTWIAQVGKLNNIRDPKDSTTIRAHTTIKIPV
jgi:hypothetical protein